MQPQGQTAEQSAAAFGSLGDELRTVLQVLFFLVLGYIIARVWRSAGFPFASKVALKTIKTVDDDEPCKDMVIESSHSQARSRKSNAQERKRLRKVVQDKVQKLENLELEVPPCHSPKESKEFLESAPPVEETAPLCQEILLANQRTVKLMMKKAERKARKALEQNLAQQLVKAEDPSTLDKPDAADSEVLEQVNQTMEEQNLTMSSMPCGKSPSMLSTKSTLCTSSASLVCSTPDSARSQSNDISECHTEEDLTEPCETTASELSHHADESGVLQESSCAINDKAPGNPDSGTPFDLACINFDDIESDTDSDVGFVEQGNASSPMADALQSCADIGNTPVMWCNPGAMCEGSQFPMHIDGWVPVAVPIECAPAGAFDGLWKNNADEKILIEKLEIMFESGVSWDMEMHSVTNISVTLKDQTFYAELGCSGTQLLWSDGDVWTFHGLPQSIAEEAISEVPCMMMPEMMPIPTNAEDMQILPVDCSYQEQMMMHCPAAEEVQMFPTVQKCMPANGEQWEICWDWQKKGWCSRGSSCEWYHPEPEHSFFCE